MVVFAAFSKNTDFLEMRNRKVDFFGV